MLVTGSAGFVGFHVSMALKNKGAGVLGIDNMIDYYPSTLKGAQLAKLEQLGIFTIEADLKDKLTLRKVLDDCKFSHVLHLAAQAGVRYAVQNPGSYVHSNVAGMVYLLEEIIRTTHTPRVVFELINVRVKHEIAFQRRRHNRFTSVFIRSNEEGR